MELFYSSTRDKAEKVTASQAILQGLAQDGGLYVPSYIPALSVDMDVLKDMSYQETAYEVMSRFLTDFSEKELKDCIAAAYDEKFDTKAIAPLKKAGEAYYLELFHGATIAFKDMALSILPHLMTTAAKKNQAKGEIVILTASSSCRLRGCARNPDHCFLSEERRESRTGKTDGNAEGSQHLCGGYSRKLRRCPDRREETFWR